MLSRDRAYSCASAYRRERVNVVSSMARRLYTARVPPSFRSARTLHPSNFPVSPGRRAAPPSSRLPAPRSRMIMSAGSPCARPISSPHSSFHHRRKPRSSTITQHAGRKVHRHSQVTTRRRRKLADSRTLCPTKNPFILLLRRAQPPRRRPLPRPPALPRPECRHGALYHRVRWRSLYVLLYQA